MVRGKIIKSKVLMRVWACMMVCLVLVGCMPVRVSANSSTGMHSSLFAKLLQSVSVPSVQKSYDFYIGNDGALYVNNSLVSYNSGVVSFSFDTGSLQWGMLDALTDNFIYDFLQFSSNFTCDISASIIGSTDISSQNMTFTYRPYIVINGQKFYLNNNWSAVLYDNPTNYFYYYFGLELDVFVNVNAVSQSVYDNLITYLGTSRLDISTNDFMVNVYGVNYISSGENAIIDSLGGLDTNIQIQIEKSEEEIALQEQQNQLQEEQNVLQEEENKLQEENNETQKNIFEKIVDFFDNFFDRLGDFLLHIIVPSAEELTAFLDEVNAWFGERLGFLWFPFSFAIEVVQVFSSGTADSNFRVPGFSLNILGTEYQIWNEITVDMDAFGIFKYVRFFTSALLIGGVVKLAVNKWDAWIGGRSAS